MSQEKKDDKPGQKRSSAPKVSASCSDVSPALHHLTLALPTGLSGLCGTGWHISPTQGGPGCTAHSTEQSLQAQSTDGGVHHCVTAQCQQNKVSLFHVLLEYLNSIILLIIYKLQVLPLGFFGIFVCCSESDGILLFFLLLFSLVSYGVFGAFDFFFLFVVGFLFWFGFVVFFFLGGTVWFCWVFFLWVFGSFCVCVFCFVFGVCFVLILTALQSQLQAPITVLFWGYFLPTSCWWFKLKIYRKCCSLKSSQTLDSKKMPFCKSMSFLITTFKVYCARETVSQQTETRKVTIQLCQSGGHQIPGNR